MSQNLLNIIQVEKKENFSANEATKKNYRKEAEARFERMWYLDPNQFDPMRNCQNRLRIERTKTLIQEFVDLKGTRTVDIGCGLGILTKWLHDAGGKVDALDLSSNALKLLMQKPLEQCKAVHYKAIQGGLPFTKLDDNVYDLVICTDVIAEISAKDYRLAVSELSRIVKLTGFVLCSTPLDIYSEDALECFELLLETEFQIDKCMLSYHAYTIRILNLIKTTDCYYQSSLDKEKRKKESSKRRGICRYWFQFNSTKPLSFLWKAVYTLFYPIIYLLEQNRSVVLFMEKICHFFSPTSGVSHAICIGKRRPLFIASEVLPEAQTSKPKERRWE